MRVKNFNNNDYSGWFAPNELLDQSYNIVQTDLLKVYNVEAYGAKHDGVIDDTEAIQEAINDCFNDGGGIVFFPNGVYILAGQLKNGIDGINYNSQLYIPASDLTHVKQDIRQIKLVGQSVDVFGSMFVNSRKNGVILKSTIAGNGTHPSVICGTGHAGLWGNLNYTDVHIINIKILVEPFIFTTGVSMCGINFGLLSRSVLDGVTVCIDCPMLDKIQPVNHVFGICIGSMQNDFPELKYVVVSGFYYGIIIGEGTYGWKVNASQNYIGLMTVNGNIPAHISNLILGGNAYSIAAQQEIINGAAIGAMRLQVDCCYIEKGYAGDGRTPAWCFDIDTILDNAGFLLLGSMNYQMSNAAGGRQFITKAHGGLDFIVNNMAYPSIWHWTTGERSFLALAAGRIGYNRTTNNIEWFDGGAYHVLP